MLRPTRLLYIRLHIRKELRDENFDYKINGKIVETCARAHYYTQLEYAISGCDLFSTGVECVHNLFTT